jgi:hypothetical protein
MSITPSRDLFVKVIFTLNTLYDEQYVGVSLIKFSCHLCGRTLLADFIDDKSGIILVR